MCFLFFWRIAIGKLVFGLIIFSFLFQSSECNKNALSKSRRFGIFKVMGDDKTVEMDGDINRKTLKSFKRMISKFPNIKKISMKDVPGSSDDRINLKVSRLVHKKNISTHVMDDGLIASGGTDFFLAGKIRTKGKNVKIGVHSWSDGDREATEFPKGSSAHKPYIDYYISVGFSKVAAKAFYYFTINSAPADEIHWMTEKEIKKYKILTKQGGKND